MDTRILEIVFYLMDYIQGSDDQMPSLTQYSSDLKNLGYSKEEISSAYSWILNHLGSSGDNLYSAFPRQPGSSRVLTDLERAQLTPEAHGFLLKLSNLGIINTEQLEKILDRLGLGGPRSITPEQVKLIASAIVFSEYGELDNSLLSDTDADLPSRIN